MSKKLVKEVSEGDSSDKKELLTVLTKPSHERTCTLEVVRLQLTRGTEYGAAVCKHRVGIHIVKHPWSLYFPDAHQHAVGATLDDLIIEHFRSRDVRWLLFIYPVPLTSSRLRVITGRFLLGIDEAEDTRCVPAQVRFPVNHHFYPQNSWKRLSAGTL